VATVRLPDLGRRGEGWVVLQVVLLIVIVGAGFLGPQWGGVARIVGVAVGLVLLFFGFALMAGGMLALRWQLTAYPRPVPGGRLIEDGAFGLVRHPMYGGGILVAIGWGLTMASLPALLGATALAVFADLKSRREEAWLAERFPGYPAYSSRTHRLIPWIY
jgi:protein-S-isoprenylcysteine O-methyltransferase Ste14